MNNVMVVTPTYCTEKNQRLPFLLQAIYWTLAQTHENRTHVIVDDGSTDETPELLERIAHHNPSIKVFHKSNGGSSEAVNFGVEQALKTENPDYITITHSDDILLPKSLESRVKLAEQTGAKMVYSDFITFYENGKFPIFRRAKDFPDAKSLYKELLHHGYIPFLTQMWDTDFFTNKLQGYDPKITSSEDWDIGLRTAEELTKSGEKHANLHEVTVAYRLHDNNIGPTSIRNGTRWKCYKRILAKHFEGKEYKRKLLKAQFWLLKAMLPESVKKPLRYLRELTLKHPSMLLPYKNEFIDSLNQIDYKKEVIPS